VCDGSAETRSGEFSCPAAAVRDRREPGLAVFTLPVIAVRRARALPRSRDSLAAEPPVAVIVQQAHAPGPRLRLQTCRGEPRAPRSPLSRLDAMPEWSRKALQGFLALTPRAVQRQLKIPRIRAVLRAPCDQPGQRYVGSLTTNPGTACAEAASVSSRAHTRRGKTMRLRFDPYRAQVGGGPFWCDGRAEISVSVRNRSNNLGSRPPQLVPCRP